MTFLDGAISTHNAWKVKLLLAVNENEVPDKAICCVDHQCELGKWIYSEGEVKYGHLTEFSNLKTNHYKFHQSIGAVIDLVLMKNIPEANKNILGGDFYACSREVVQSILDLKRLVE